MGGIDRSTLRAAARVSALLLGLVALLACPRRPLSHPIPLERTELAPGRFVDGAAAGQPFGVPGGMRLRGLLQGKGGAAARATLLHPDGREQTFEARAGEELPLDEPLTAGSYQLELGPGSVLAEARLVRPAKGRSVVLVVVDTLRDDHIAARTTPQILAAFTAGRRFTDTLAGSSWTLPSMASLLTGRSVIELTAPAGDLIGIPAGVETLAERFQAAGYATAAFVANDTLREGNGFGRGFGRFETPAERGGKKQDAGALLAAARAFLAAHAGEDAFVLLHLMETHEPLRDHRGRGRSVVNNRILAMRERAATPEEAETFRTLYREEVEHLDGTLGPFFATLPRDAVVALTADHGEMLGEEGVWGHGLTVFDPVLRVPLLMRAPGMKAGEERGPAALVDLAPTLLAAAGLAVPEGLAGRNLARPLDPQRERVAATFSAGPLRWAWHGEGEGVIAHFAPQPGYAPQATVTLAEQQPLWTGLRARGTQHEAEGALLTRAARAFAADIGHLTPGLQVLAVGLQGGAEIEIEATGEKPLIQLFATAPAAVERQGDQLRLSWPVPQPLALVVFDRASNPRPRGPGWIAAKNVPPPITTPGLFAWFNERTPAEQKAQEEILERLRALGYIQ